MVRPAGQAVPEGRAVQPVEVHPPDGDLVAAVLRAAPGLFKPDPGPEAAEGIQQVRASVAGLMGHLHPPLPRGGKNGDVLRHRIGLTYEAEANNMTSDEIISKILNKVEVP